MLADIRGQPPFVVVLDDRRIDRFDIAENLP